jgi:acetoin utilization deacetylase AcuC-like enzyme
VDLVPSGKLVLFLEGGYDMDALCASTAGTFAALAGETLHVERPTGHGPGRDVVQAARTAHLHSR